MSSNIFLFNASIRHQIFLQRFAGGEAKTMQTAVVEARRASKRILGKKEVMNLTKRQQAGLINQMAKEVGQIYGVAAGKLLGSLEEFADYEAGFNLRMLENATDTTIKAATTLAITNEVFNKKIAFGLRGEIDISQALKGFSKNKSREIVRTVKDGILKGETNQQIRSSLTSLSTSIQRTQANTLVRTIVNHTSTGAKTALYKANSDVIQEVKYTAVLDARTTAICGGLDGKTFPLGKGPRPPMHWNCRSIMTPVVKKKFDTVPDVKTTRFARNEEGKSNVGGKTTYNSWLKGQSSGFQDEVLGTSRAKLLREGGLSVDKFTDNNFKSLNLKQLKRMEPLAFQKAGLE